MTNKLELDSVDVARHIAHLCSENNYEYNNTKIQKLLYICYGIFLAKNGVRLLDEQPQAWPYGPVFPNAFKYINESKKDYQKQTSFSDENIAKELNKIIKCFGKHAAGKLSAWSHIKDSPWDQIVGDKNSPQWSEKIPDEIIKKYFEEKVMTRNVK